MIKTQILPQKWHKIATPGHQLYECVNSYMYKTRVPMYAISGALAVAIAAVILIPKAGDKLTVGASKFAHSVSTSTSSGWAWVKGKTTTKPVVDITAQDAEPKVKAILGLLPQAEFDPAQVVEVNDWANRFRANAAAIATGNMPSICTAGQITEPWTDAIALQTAHCRAGASGSGRAWIWGFAKSGESFGAFAFLATTKGELKLYNIFIKDGLLATNVDQGPGLGKTLPPLLIPRALSADFPELQE